MEHKNNLSLGALKNDFQAPKAEYGVCAYLECYGIDDVEIIHRLENMRKSGIYCVIPVLFEKPGDPVDYDRIIRLYSKIAAKASELGVSVILNLEKAVESDLVRRFDDYDGESIRAKVLLHREYGCTYQEEVNIAVQDGAVSVVAKEERGELVDLRRFISDGFIRWTAPMGNWNIYQFFCREDDESDRANYLRYASSKRYLDEYLSLFDGLFEGTDMMGGTVIGIGFEGIGFNSRNRRDWDENFGELFEEMFGFDGTPYYPMLYGTTYVQSDHYKALLMSCRAKMLKNGIVKALSDSAAERGLKLFSQLIEPKISASSWTVGDALAMQSDSPCAVLEKSYLYGVNSLKIAAGAAYCYDCDTVGCSMLGGFESTKRELVGREASTAFARGANFVMFYPKNQGWDIKQELLKTFIAGTKNSELTLMAARCQSLLRGGVHVSDIALLYPIYSLHSRVCLYESPVGRGFEYPDTPDIIDYMTLINSISAYSGYDLTVLHPEVMTEKCHVSGGKLYLSNKVNRESFSVIALPAGEVISIHNLRMIAEFFDGGGKVLATGVLPTKSYEFTPEQSYDDEVRELVLHIFGEYAYEEKITGDFISNKNDNGGEAYFLVSTTTGVDRTNIVQGSLVASALASFDLPYDIIVENMPRLECTGALNNHFPEFKLLGLTEGIHGGGLFNHIHKRRGNCDIYYFSNSSNVDYNGTIRLRGSHRPEELHPAGGKIRKPRYTLETKRGEVYTCIPMEIKSGESVFIVSEK